MESGTVAFGGSQNGPLCGGGTMGDYGLSFGGCRWGGASLRLGERGRGQAHLLYCGQRGPEPGGIPDCRRERTGGAGHLPPDGRPIPGAARGKRGGLCRNDGHRWGEDADVLHRDGLFRMEMRPDDSHGRISAQHHPATEHDGGGIADWHSRKRPAVLRRYRKAVPPGGGDTAASGESLRAGWNRRGE